ncbi:MAG: hypothetical protein IKH13_10870 [Clostridia bacterium]|nr:hypothetical protein [Clostridia bacterium]
MIPKWNYDYSQTLWMKMFLAKPDFENNRSQVLISFRQALEIIRIVDNLTQGIKKIVYLVGWQGLGHDDCYPEMNVINEALKSDDDADGRQALYNLIEEAKKYNTVVSFHVNVADAYEATPSFPDLVRANAIVNGTDGKPAVIEVFNGRNAYKTSYKYFWESGLFREIWERFCQTVPVREAGTVHIDNFCIAQNLNPLTTVHEENEARNKMLDYILSLGIDVTSEYTYREAELRTESLGHPIGKLYATLGRPRPEADWRDVPIYTLGRIAATWWTSGMTEAECVSIPPALYSGHLTEKGRLKAFYGAMHGEDIWMNNGTDPDIWVDLFVREFCTLQLPYFYLNRHERLSYEKKGEDITVYFSDGIVSEGATGTITKNGAVLKSGSDVLLPLDKENTLFIAYSENGKSGDFGIPDADFGKADVYEITREGNKFITETPIKDGRISLGISPRHALAIKGK